MTIANNSNISNEFHCQWPGVRSRLSVASVVTSRAGLPGLVLWPRAVLGHHQVGLGHPVARKHCETVMIRGTVATMMQCKMAASAPPSG